MKHFLAILVTILCGYSAHAGEESSLKYDIYFKTLEDAKAIDQSVLGTPDKQLGALTDVYICVSTQVVSNKLSEKMSQVAQQTFRTAIQSVAFGKKILAEMEKQDPNFLNFDLEQVPAAVECKGKIEKALEDSRVNETHIRSVVRLGEIGGAILGSELTSGL